MTATEPSELSNAGLDEGARFDAPVSPWARGGAMSVGWHGTPGPAHGSASSERSGSPRADMLEPTVRSTDVMAARQVGNEPVGSTRVVRSDPPVRRPPTGLVVMAIVAAIALAATIAIAGSAQPSEGVSDRESGADREVALPRPTVRGDTSVLATGSDGIGVMPTEPVVTGVGQIAWTRIDGDRRSLPARVADVVESGALMGDDSSANHWISRDGGENWTQLSQPSLTRSVGGIDWTARELAGEAALWWRDGGTGMRPVELGPGVAATEHEGFTLRVEPTAELFPVALSDRLFLPVTVRAEIPWRDLLDLHPTRAYRLEIDVDGREVRVVAGDFHELDVERLHVSETGPERFEIRRDDGEQVGWFGAPADGMSLADVVSGRPLTLWTQWTGDGFERVAAPWEPHDRVDVASTATVVLARVVSPDRGAALWRSFDGASWTEVELPVESLDRASVTIDQLEGEVVATAFTERGLVSLTTVDGTAWVELAPVPGANRRDRADFGWIAPPTRSEPQIRVSADGLEWELVDLRTMLGLEYSRWDVRISAAAIGSDIFVIADQGDVRTLLIGSVSTD